MSSFPQYRPRRLRRTAALRNLVRETHLAPAQLVLPVFVRDGKKLRRPVGSMPGVNQTSVDEMVRDAEAASFPEEGLRHPESSTVPCCPELSAGPLIVFSG